MNKPKSQSLALSISGRIAALFQSAQITPLLALVALLLGIFAVMVTPREEEPQINVTMANVLVPFPGAAVRDVEQMVAIPAEQVLSKIAGVEHVMSVSRPGVVVLTVQFKVGVPRTEALVRLHDTIRNNADWLPKGLGVMEPLVKPKGVDDVPIVTLTLFSKSNDASAYNLERVAHSMEADIKRVKGTQDVQTLGGPDRAVLVQIEPERMAGFGVSVSDLRMALQSANMGFPVGELITGNKSVSIEAGPFLSQASDVADLVVGVQGGRAVFLKDVAKVEEGPLPATRYVTHGLGKATGGGEYPAVTLTITKKPGENAIDVANAVMDRVAALRGTVIPDEVQVAETRNYGATANDKAQKLIQKLLFATASVVALVFIARGKREAAIVGTAVILTLTVTLFASWAWGFTLNRVSLFALIFSIGILVDDAIVVIENINRHLAYGEPKAQAVRTAVREVAGAITAATITTVAVFLPIALVDGLVGELFRPFSFTFTIALLASLLVSLTIVPVLAYWFMKPPKSVTAQAAAEKTEQTGAKGKDVAESNVDSTSSAAYAATAPSTRVKRVSKKNELSARELEEERERRSWLQRGYLPILRGTQKRPVVTLVAAAAILGFTFSLVPQLKTNFIGDSGSNSFSITQELEAGATLEQKSRAALKVESILLDPEGVEGGLAGAVKVHRVILKAVVRCEVHATTEPAHRLASLGRGRDHAHVHVHRRHIGIARVEHERNAHGLEWRA